MKLMPDNTGLIAATRCLTGKAKNESDVKDFLQFAVSVMIGDYIVAEFEEKAEPYQASKWSTDFLYSKFKLKIPRKRYKDNIYSKICDAAFNEFKTYFSSILKSKPNQYLIKWSVPFLKYKNTLEDTVIILNNIYNLDELKSSSNRNILNTPYKKSMDAVKFLIIKKANEFRELLNKRDLKNCSFSPKEVDVLDSILRILLNKNIAKMLLKSGAYYIPAYNRSEMISKSDDSLLNYIESVVKKSINEMRNESIINDYNKFYDQLKPVSLPLPQDLSGFLLMESKGEPEKMLKIAMDYKNKFKTKQIDKLIDEYFDPEKYFKLLDREKQEIRNEITRKIINIITKKDEVINNSLVKKIEITALIGANILDWLVINAPVASTLVGSLSISGFFDNLSRNKNILLTEVVKRIFYYQGTTDGNIKDYYKKLVRNSGINK